MTKLVFGKANAKLKELEKFSKRKVYTFSLRAGHTCPFANECFSRAVETPTGIKIKDGPDTLWRCYAASMDAIFPSLYKKNKNNEVVLEYASRSAKLAAQLISLHIPPKAGIVRIHVGGDFKTQNYFDAWLKVAEENPHIWFYAYTKSLPFLVKRLDELPSNFFYTASYGGKKDSLIEKYRLRFNKVVYTVDEAAKLNIPIDHDDRYAAMPEYKDTCFGTLIHGMMPKGSEAGKAVRELNGLGSYSSKRV